MLAIFQEGGTQHKAKVGTILSVQKIESSVGSELCFDRVQCLIEGGSEPQVCLGTPYVEGAKVRATVLRQYRGKKIQIIKLRRRKHSMRRQGHRQYLTEIRITGIESGSSR